jgi:hypothetical protein
MSEIQGGPKDEAMAQIARLKRLVRELVDELEEEFGKGRSGLADKKPWSLLEKARKELGNEKLEQIK